MAPGAAVRLLLLTLAAAFATLFMPADPKSAAVAAAAIVVALLAAVAFTDARNALPRFALSTTGPESDERCLHGSFRRQGNPDAPGRPRPRAPGNGLSA